MLEILLFVTKGCTSSQYMEERVEQAILDLDVADKVRVDIVYIEGNKKLAKQYDVTDAPALICCNTKDELHYVASPARIRAFISINLNNYLYVSKD